MMTRTLYVTLAVIAAVLLGVGGFAAYREFATPTPSSPTKQPTYTCPENGWENCMPILTPEAQRQCTKEAIEWKKKYCSGFQGAAL